MEGIQMYTNPPTKMAILIKFHQIRKDRVGPEEYMPTDEIAVPITVAIIISMMMMMMMMIMMMMMMMTMMMMMMMMIIRSP